MAAEDKHYIFIPVNEYEITRVTSSLDYYDSGNSSYSSNSDKEVLYRLKNKFMDFKNILKKAEPIEVINANLSAKLQKIFSLLFHNKKYCQEYNYDKDKKENKKRKYWVQSNEKHVLYIKNAVHFEVGSFQFVFNDKQYLIVYKMVDEEGKEEEKVVCQYIPEKHFYSFEKKHFAIDLSYDWISEFMTEFNIIENNIKAKKDKELIRLQQFIDELPDLGKEKDKELHVIDQF